jgi:hypothetical protein
MTTSFPELADPRETFLEAGYQPATPAKPKDSSHLLLIGMGIGAAILGIKMVMSHQLAKKNPQSPEEARSLALNIWEANRYVWRTLATPSVVDAYKLGGPSLFIPPDALEKLAVVYVDELGDYFNQTSVDALVEGFSAQLNSGWSNDISWRRSTPAYGLDSKQTRSYVITLTEQAKGKYDPQPIPEKSAAAIDKLMLDRADRIGSNEAYKATQMGRNTVWLYMEKHGDIHGAKKRWLTAEDERVCSVCASLDRQEKDLGDPFETPTGEKIHAPGAHPNCRCEIVLNMGMSIIKNMPGDPFDRDHHGRFANREERKGNPVGVETRLPPIGSYHAPIGDSGSPIGTMTGPIGWARGPIGTTLPPIGTRAAVASELPPIGLAPAELKPTARIDRPKIGQAKNQIKSPNPSKIRAKIKSANTAQVPIESSIVNPNPTGIGSKSDIDHTIQMHQRPMVLGGSSVIAMSPEFDSWVSHDAEGKFILFDGSESLGFVGDPKTGLSGLNSSGAFSAAFDQEMSYLLPSASSADLPYDNTYGSKGKVVSSVQGSAAIEHKVPIVVYVFESGWKGSLINEAHDDQPGMGSPIGWYEVTRVHSIPADTIKNQRRAFPESVLDMIENGINAGGFTHVANASDLTSDVIYVYLKPSASRPPSDQILKRAPRLILRRK